MNTGQQGLLAHWQRELLRRHKLQPTYLAAAQHWFDPLADKLVQARRNANRPLLIALNGSQGSGKSTLCAYLEMSIAARHQLRVVTLSLDDFYFSRVSRLALSQKIHPLLATRGVPGTHDIPKLTQCLDDLLDADRTSPVAIPRFDKATDNPYEQAEQLDGAIDIVLLEGWCIGARPQPIGKLVEPINSLERSEDADGVWRNYVNSVLARGFVPLYQRVDQWVMLQAPSFACVFEWRREQEHKLRQSRGGKLAAQVMDARELARFIQYYERITAVCLEQLPRDVDHLFVLDESRLVKASRLGRETAD